MTTMLPDAIERERETMLQDTMSLLKTRGYGHFDVHELPGFAEPREVTIPVLNVHMRPDIHARDDQGHELLAVIEPSTDLGEEACGRRWQMLESWAQGHNAEVHVFVHPEDERRAGEIARLWHLDTSMIEPLPRTH
ncbi:MAG: hypothetical protein LPK58_06650 [Gammaproteobacteria bacterium]|nr:hypothetical protein [Gammaproteobacteria bacterium]MDX5375253.1 hypothetical protein [Gammaproteobacteria bacterium]